MVANKDDGLWLNKELLLDLAINEYGADITPLNKEGDFSKAFQIIDGVLILWFNDREHSTHIKKMEISQ